MKLQKLVDHYEKLTIKHNKDPHAIKWLITELSGYSPTQFYANLNTEVSLEIESLIESGYKKYVFENIPVQHITGFSYFYGYKFKVNEHVLIPRRETEELVEETLLIYDQYFSNKKVDVLDLGTGSGNIAITLSLEEDNLNVDAIDVSTKALEVAKINNNELGGNVNFFQSDWFSNVTKKYDIIIANPPYIPNNEHVDDIVLKEPNLALFGGVIGLEPYEIILKESKNFLNSNAFIGFEHSMFQSAMLKEMILKYHPNAIIKQLKDLQGKDRMSFVLIGDLFK
ncbi:peptide chain release factor N(5)-glutamine methyltransferase [Acholeplasma granularum]|uniref:peptide chain release factor N(5)-glutamine methyltransferase n=1 Tax=Acholeplasma granularum TaxID=264635 RepID=UPI0004AFD408|nr:peptide chain release factor N(5)-glutamine methyltransferase [Acholeplasma granularum]